MNLPFRKSFIIDQVSANGSFTYWLPWDGVSAPPYSDANDVRMQLQGFLTGVTIRRGTAGYNVTSFVCKILEDLSIIASAAVEGRLIHQSPSYDGVTLDPDGVAYPVPAQSSTVAFHDKRFDPEYFHNGLWIVLTIASDYAGADADWFVTLQGEFAT